MLTGHGWLTLPRRDVFKLSYCMPSVATATLHVFCTVIHKENSSAVKLLTGPWFLEGDAAVKILNIISGTYELHVELMSTADISEQLTPELSEAERMA